jgi:hypothetical protein
MKESVLVFVAMPVILAQIQSRTTSARSSTVTVRQSVVQTSSITPTPSFTAKGPKGRENYKAATVWNDKETVKEQGLNRILIILCACLAGVGVILGSLLGVYFYRVKHKRKHSRPIDSQFAILSNSNRHFQHCIDSEILSKRSSAYSIESIQYQNSIAPGSSVSQTPSLEIITEQNQADAIQLNDNTSEQAGTDDIKPKRPFSFVQTPSDMVGTFIDIEIDDIEICDYHEPRAKIPVPRDL